MLHPAAFLLGFFVFFVATAPDFTPRVLSTSLGHIWLSNGLQLKESLQTLQLIMWALIIIEVGRTA